MSKTKHCGLIALVGRPNVGKSTLLNKLIGEKISITCDKPQTTRHKILGIKTQENHQMVFVDTPGIHKQTKSLLNKRMNKAAYSALTDVDSTVMVTEAGIWRSQDDKILHKLCQQPRHLIIVINKSDCLDNKNELLPHIEAIQNKLNELKVTAEIIPISATKGHNLDKLTQMLISNLPESEFYFPEDAITDKSERFLAAEWIREQLMRHLGQEVPYGLTVSINQFTDTPKLITIDATIWVVRKGHKGIVIGKGGSLLKTVGQKARINMERQFDKKVHLQLWTKIREQWINDPQTLSHFGYD